MTYRFGAFYLDVKQRFLVGPHDRHQLSQTLFRILLLLVEARGAILTRATLVSEVWDGGFVAEATITQHIFRLRQLLRDESHARAYIITEPGQGYRLEAEVLQD